MELPEVELKLCAVGGVEADERNTEAEKGLRVPFGVEVVEAVNNESIRVIIRPLEAVYISACD